MLDWKILKNIERYLGPWRISKKDDPTRTTTLGWDVQQQKHPWMWLWRHLQVESCQKESQAPSVTTEHLYSTHSKCSSCWSWPWWCFGCRKPFAYRIFGQQGAAFILDILFWSLGSLFEVFGTFETFSLAFSKVFATFDVFFDMVCRVAVVASKCLCNSWGVQPIIWDGSCNTGDVQFLISYNRGVSGSVMSF